jgi:phage terminase large subunit-like protein
LAIDRVTRRWIKNAADERAVSSQEGCKFDRARVENKDHTGILDFFRDNVRLYEGEDAGKPIDLMAWQIDFLSRLAGWVRFSKELGRWIRRFQHAALWCPKKNGKSPTGAGLGLWLTCADGEPGNHVFDAAKDGKQAGIMHTHAIYMVQKSPALRRECRINRSTGRIVHLPTLSTYDILTSGGKTEEQEGINGSVIIDEAHVVDARLAEVIQYAGASRPEPLQVSLSTAGDNPEGWGKERFDYGEAVNAGTILDAGFLHLAYGAPQDIGDKDCGKVSVWKKANPAWGRTIHPQEFKHSYQKARRTPAGFASWKRYRLNVWQRTANPWLRFEDWIACRRDVDLLRDFRGEPCWLGLDLSKTTDMTALDAVFKDKEEEDRFWLFAWFWLPEAIAVERSHLASYQQWRADGFLNYCSGETIDQRDVKAKIEELAKLFRIRQIRYDPIYAEELTKQLDEELGVERVEFKQTILHFAGPCAEFERLVLSQRIHHDGNPLLAWQIGHCNIWADGNKNRRPIKPKPGDFRGIDGVVAALMALSGAMAGDGEGTSGYENRGPLYAGDLADEGPGVTEQGSGEDGRTAAVEAAPDWDPEWDEL